MQLREKCKQSAPHYHGQQSKWMSEGFKKTIIKFDDLHSTGQVNQEKQGFAVGIRVKIREVLGVKSRPAGCTEAAA